jgi:hypothetical protein
VSPATPPFSSGPPPYRSSWAPRVASGTGGQRSRRATGRADTRRPGPVGQDEPRKAALDAGADELAVRRGRTYAAILVDMTTHPHRRSRGPHRAHLRGVTAGSSRGADRLPRPRRCLPIQGLRRRSTGPASGRCPASAALHHPAEAVARVVGPTAPTCENPSRSGPTGTICAHPRPSPSAQARRGACHHADVPAAARGGLPCPCIRRRVGDTALEPAESGEPQAERAGGSGG